MTQLERKGSGALAQDQPNALTRTDGWKWEGDPRYALVALRLKQEGFNPQEYSSYGLAFFLGQSAQGGTLSVESRIYETSSIRAISQQSRYALSDFLDLPFAYQIDVIYAEGRRMGDSIDFPVYGPAHADPREFAASFFFTLREFLARKSLPVPSVLQLEGSHTTGSSVHLAPS